MKSSHSTGVLNACVNIDKLRQIRSSIKAGIINTNEIDEFLERIEMQLPDKKGESKDAIYCRGKLVKKSEY